MGFYRPFFSTDQDLNAVPASPIAVPSTPGLIGNFNKPIWDNTGAPLAYGDGGATSWGVSAPGSSNFGAYAGAGLQAAGQAASMISQAASAAAQRDAMAANSAEDRALQSRLAKQRLTESARQFDTSRQSDAYRTLLAAYSSQIGNIDDSRTNRRNSASMSTDLLGNAILRG